ncbi:T9SS type A sorting domain-containing protein [Hymenobacter sp. J193]|uniref:T9SS type A sorting domain-containing protein n=1 Tax=Hymenobacter sp. J193 TaxID=2898429 RepID=UPI0021518974|nr:T9SS type A sorting domain-containing protein [Hymenobacter sp. J193]MCR5888266.1 T9SS type A sorting domain-containing protein [Hymenobacter sp. J193]
MIRRVRLGLLIGLLAAGPLGAQAQQAVSWGLEYQPLAKVAHGSETLPLAWAGGFNAPQFSSIDLNQDGWSDLFAFDRMSNRATTYLNVTDAAGQHSWQYAPQYEALFPTEMRNWALLRDYDCDGRPDLFTHANGGDIRVYRQDVDAQGQLKFTLVSSQLQFFNSATNSGNIFAGAYDVPSIDDVDGDGKLDLLLMDFVSASTVSWYRNVSPACGGLSFRLETNYWGRFNSCFSSCTSFVFDASCRAAAPQHTGGFMLTSFDLDGDGDRDLLTGRDQCPELVSLHNDGTPAQALMKSAGQNAQFPAGTTPVLLPNFPGAYFADVTFDGRPDLLVAPTLINNADQVALRQNTWLYANTGTGAAPAFTYRQPDFLQGQMVDVSEAATPALADIDGNGLLDLLVASAGDVSTGGTYRAALHYYRNEGSAQQPAFKRVSEDYLGLAAKGFTNLKPTFADLNKDGALDLAFGASLNGAFRLWYLLNQAAAGQPARFELTQLKEAAGLGNLISLAPAFADLDGDQYPDLVVGTNETSGAGALRYYRQVPGAELQFTLVMDDFGQVRTADDYVPTNLQPLLVDLDGDGKMDLLTSDNSGAVRFFADVAAQTGAFTGRTDLFYQPLTGQYGSARLGSSTSLRLGLAAADLTGDQQPELLIGLEEGGLQSFRLRRDVETATRPAKTTFSFQVYPVPATNQATVETPVPTRLTVLDLTGRVVRTVADLRRVHQLQLQGLARGVYVVRAEAANGQLATRRLVVR